MSVAGFVVLNTANLTILGCRNSGEYKSEQYKCYDMGQGQNHTGFVTQNRGVLLIKNSFFEGTGNENKGKHWGCLSKDQVKNVYGQAWVNMNFDSRCAVQGGSQRSGVVAGWVGRK